MKNNSWWLKDFYSWSDARIAFAIYIVAQIFFLIFLFRGIPAGDATEGLYQITQFDLYHRAPFVAYHAIGVLFVQSLSIIGISPVIALNFMSSFFGAIGASFTYKFAKHFLGNTKNALLATAFTVFSGTYWLFSEIGDSYIVHTAFLLISLVMFLERRFIFSGITYGVALLVYPQVGLIAPFYAIIAYQYRYGFKNFLKTVVSATVIYLPVVIILFQEYFWGRMGLLGAIIGSSKLRASHHDILHLLKGIYFLAKSLHIALPLMIIGFYICFLRNRLLAFLTLLLVPIHLYMNITLTADLDPYSLSIYPFLGILSALGLTTLFDSTIFRKHYFKALFTVFLAYIVLSFILIVGPLKNHVHDFRNFAESFHVNQNQDYRIISEWGVCINYNFYTSSTLYSGKCLSYENSDDKTIKALFSCGIPLYFVDTKDIKNPLKTAIKKLLPQRYVSKVRLKTGVEELLEIGPEYKLKLIEKTPFYVYELYL